MHVHARPLCRLLLSLCTLSMLAAWGATAGLPSSAAAADTAVDTWHCLPEETAFAVRIPNGKAIAEACVQNTKLGAVIFSEKRREILAEALRKSQSDAWEEVQQKLSEYGLSTDDLLQFFAGESGYAMVVTKDESDEPLALGLSWLEPGEELATRAYDILARAIDEQEDAKHAIGREDLELADRPVMQLMLPHVSTEHETDLDLPEGYSQMSDDERQPAWDEAYKKWQDSAVETTSYSAALVSTVGSRMLLAHGFRKSASQSDNPDVEPLTEIFARLLAEHASGGGGFVDKYADDQGVSRVMSLDGVGVLELQGDLATLLRLGRAAANYDEKSEKIMRILGADCLGPFALRSTLQDTQWHSQLSLAISQPRQGIMQWLDQPPLESDIPAWVPANAITVGQVSFDLGKAYAILKEEITREFPQQAGQYFNMAEMQVVGFAQTSLEQVLSSLGTRHVMLNFESPLDSSASLEQQQPESTAVVWQVTDEPLWTRLMQAMAPMVKSMPGGEFTDEQGYSGFRFKRDPIEGGLFLGNGNLVLAYGPQVLETTLSALNNPPSGAGAFRGSEIYRQATELLEPTPSWGYKVVDGNRSAAIFRTWMLSFLKQQQESDYDEEAEDDATDASWAEVARQLMPTEAEMKDMLGVTVSRWEVSDHGLFGESVQETPPPDGR